MTDPIEILENINKLQKQLQSCKDPRRTIDLQKRLTTYLLEALKNEDFLKFLAQKKGSQPFTKSF